MASLSSSFSTPAPKSFSSASFTTPAPKSKQNKGNPYKTPSHSTKVGHVDLVTGKAIVEYFFDPLLIINENVNPTTPFKSSKRAISDRDNVDNPLLYNSKHLYAPCTIVKSLLEENDVSGGNRRVSIQPVGPALVKTRDGTLYKIKDATKLTSLTSPDDYKGLDDVLHLTNVTEPSLLHTLRIRYKRDIIYTSAGPILISINPYKPIFTNEGESIYSEQTMLRYRTASNYAEDEPHLFNTADRAYSAMMDSVHSIPNLKAADADRCIESPKNYRAGSGNVLNQSIIISGESGAGKTEATKYIMKYLARITQKKAKWRSEESAQFLSPDGKVMAALEDRVLSSNPLLETFGNAQTLRNDNSSRFGKFIHIRFSTEKGIITGARISNYLLEKTRITTQIEGERNYHIFYQLFAGADHELLEELGLDAGTSQFRYLGYRSSLKAESDKNNFNETMASLSNVGLATDEQKIVMGLAAAVLHIGNISFQESNNEDHSAVITEASRLSLQKACELLGLNENDVMDAILTKLLTVNGKSITKSSTVAMAEDKRDALAKIIYSSLFLWLVKSINLTLGEDEEYSSATNDSKQTGFIGVLDIYGFECFGVNGYEQLLINYCNEKLQRHFNRHIFEVEQKLYASEGVNWTYITFNDNQPCLELMEGGAGIVGILNTLDDSFSGMGSSGEKDIKFVSQLHKLFGNATGTKNNNGGHKHFVTPKFGNDCQFNITHYAGEVRYTADGFVEKNMESTSNELKDLGSTSIIPLVRDVLGVAATTDDRRSLIRGFSVASQFKQSLQSLVDDLEMTQPHYIRCIKPNLDKCSNQFHAGEVLKQLRYSGMMEAIRIRREGYALREDHSSFYNRFSVLLSADDLKGGIGIEHLVKVLSERLNVTEADCQIGHSKIFLRSELSDKLEQLAKLRILRAARTLGRFGRLVAARQASLFIVTWMKFRLKMKTVNRRNKASSKISATYKMHLRVQLLQRSIRSVVMIQSLQRKIAAKLYARKLQDPFFDLSHKELKTILQSEIKCMESAIDSQDFRRAANIEEKIESIKIAIEERQPMTRQRLEEKISATENQLDIAINSKNYKEAGPLQDELESLTNLRKDYPTIEELEANVRKAEDAVAIAAKKRDFANAASLQLEIDKAKTRLQDAQNDIERNEDIDENQTEETLYVSIDGIDSRAHLEKELISLHSQIKAAISNSNFQLASELQTKIGTKEKLRSFFPSVDELNDELRSAKKSLEDAISRKDFGTASKMNDEISRLEKRIEDESEQVSMSTDSDNGFQPIIGLDGNELIFESRHSLEKEIRLNTSMQALQVSSKNFQKAEEIQSLIVKLESIRSNFPTVFDLRDKISTKKEAMKKAISEKRFADAELIDNEINIIDLKLQAELKIEQQKVVLNTNHNVTSKLTVKLKCKSTTVDDVASQNSSGTGVVSIRKAKKNKLKIRPVDDPLSSSGIRCVQKLRPKKALLSSANDSVLSVCQMLSSKRGEASLIVNDEGGLAGIITDTDITRRLVAKQLDASSTNVSKVMTPNPTCVSLLDSAMDAMTIMVENHFRHLPVVDDKGSVVGLLDIAKCLNDAISKLEKSGSKNESEAQSAAQEALNQAIQSQSHGSKLGSQATALQALLGPLMNQAFGNQASPTIRSLLAGKPSAIVQPGTSVFEAGTRMAESRKAALVVEDGNLVGIFGFKDMMTRVVAKELPMEDTEISAVMTPNPESITPDMTVLEALQTMHENKFLTLPVCEKNGTVIGLVNVMDVIYGCGGVQGWRSIFNTALDLDDISDEISSATGNKSIIVGSGNSKTNASSSCKVKSNDRQVSSLRPKKALLSLSGDSVLSVSQMLVSKRGTASLIVNDEGGLAGIITDTDITRRLVAKQLDASSTNVSKVMTPNPTCVSLLDSAMDAMTAMVENHFRHLPVVDDKGSVVGLLDIAKCLNDAISKLEKSGSKNESEAQSAAQEALNQAIQSQSHGSELGSQATALQALLGPLMNQAFGNQTSPTIRSLLAGKPSAIVQPGTSVFEAGTRMAESRKAALVVEDGNLVGIFGFKDMMTRVVAKELPMEDTEISAVMTPNPESITPDMTVLEALQIMHENKFLTLPVCEKNGTVIGLVNVMDVIYGCGGVQGWRSIFNTALDLDDLSETVSYSSEYSNALGGVSSVRSNSLVKASESKKTVMNLRPRKPQISSEEDTILAVTKKLKLNRSDASVVVDSAGQLKGIITDTDVTRRVVAKGLNIANTCVTDVMTSQPKFVNHDDMAMDAMMLMIEHKFRHLPVLNGINVVGTLDIAKCLNDAISKLDRSSSEKPNATKDLMRKAIKSTVGTNGASLEAVLYPLLIQAFGTESIPSLRTISRDMPCVIIPPETNVFDAACAMGESRKAALVVDGGHLVGIFGFKDMMTHVVAEELDQGSTAVSKVMTPDPEFAEPEMNAIEALKMMHDNKFLTLPICEEDGSVVGVVDVMDVIHACGGPDYWRSIFEAALQVDDESANESGTMSVVTSPVKNEVTAIKVPKDVTMVSSQPHFPGTIPSTLEFQKGINEDLDGTTLNDTYRLETGSFISHANTAVFKIVDHTGHTHRIRTETKIDCLLEAFAVKLPGRLKAKNISFKFFDDEGDAILITTDADLAEAVTLSRNTSEGGKLVVKLMAEIKEVESNGTDPILTVVGVGIAVVTIVIGTIMFSSKQVKASRY